MRKCQICGETVYSKIHRQNFVFPGENLMLHYTVVSCDSCGFVYADEIPSQEKLDVFYESAQHHVHAINLPPGLVKIHADFFQFIKAHIPDLIDRSILDIGSSMGHFLSHFKESGILDITGLEPSSTAKKLAKERYGIDVVPNNLNEYNTDKHFGLITLCGVLEHIESLGSAIKKIKTLLDFNGYFFVAVPDAEKFGSLDLKEPFLEFAMEHINFFSQASLNNLLSAHGFEFVDSESVYNEFYNNNYIVSLFKISNETHWFGSPIFDAVTTLSVKSYVDNSNKLLIEINKIIDQLSTTQEPIIVWGAGSFSARLCATTKITQTNLIAFVDNNPQLQGKTLIGKPICSPSWIQYKQTCTILIASSTYAKEIKFDLLNRHKWSGKILCL